VEILQRLVNNSHDLLDLTVELLNTGAELADQLAQSNLQKKNGKPKWDNRSVQRVLRADINALSKAHLQSIARARSCRWTFLSLRSGVSVSTSRREGFARCPLSRHLQGAWRQRTEDAEFRRGD